MPDSDEKGPATPGHSLEDHLYGDYGAHEHGPDADHDHDDFELSGPLEDNPIWIQDNVTLRSVGIDIGSAGTQVVFSRIHLRRHGEGLDIISGHYVPDLYSVELKPWPRRGPTRK